MFSEALDVSRDIPQLWIFIAINEWRKAAIEVIQIAHSFKCEPLVGMLRLKVPVRTWRDVSLFAEVFQEVSFTQPIFFK